jgi:hypothetical protein
MKWRVVIILCLFIFAAFAVSSDKSSAFTHGFNSTFNCNNFGGTCACFMSAASGQCSNATAHNSNAVCDGVTDDHVAMKDWLTYANGLYPSTVAVLFVPPVCRLHLDGATDASCSFQANVLAGEVGLPNNSIVWAFGVTTDCLWIGGLGYPNGTVGGIPQQALINTVAAGSTTVTVNDGNIGTFSIGRWIAVTGICTQVNQSGNPSQQFFEYKKITNIIGNVITLDSPLVNSYESTWPLLDLGSAGQDAQGGAALIYLMDATWDVSGTLYGITVNTGGQTNIVGRDLSAIGVVWQTNGFAPSSAKRIYVSGGSSPTIEVDKNFEVFSLNNHSVASNIVVQSNAGTMNLLGVQAAGLVGTTTNTTIQNSRFDTIFGGPTCCGAGNSLTLNNVTFTTAHVNYHFGTIANYTFSSGTLIIAASDTAWKNTDIALWVPGHKYYVGDSDGSNTCSPANTFTVTDVSVNGSNINISTNLPSISFGNTCGGGTRAPTTFGSYNVMSFSATNSGPGNMLSNPEMLAPP